MINAQEHFHYDDPQQGHPDVRTRLKNAYYFFLGNGHIQAAIQIAPAGEGTPIGLLIMNPNQLGKKRQALTMSPKNGLEDTMLTIIFPKSSLPPAASQIHGSWCYDYGIPAVRIDWQTHGLQLSERFYCPELSMPRLVREVRLKNMSDVAQEIEVRTGIKNDFHEKHVMLAPGAEEVLYFSYQLLLNGAEIELSLIPSAAIQPELVQYWEQTTHVHFHSDLLDHYFNAANMQLAAVVSQHSIVDASIWQYNGEWVRDHSMMALGMTLAGHLDLAKKMLRRLFADFVSDQGDTVDSSQKRATNEVELDQNGILLFVLKHYVSWTGDFDLVHEEWPKIELTAQFPLQEVFRHPHCGLLCNQREYWERHGIHGIEPGMELAYQFWVSQGLAAAAALAKSIGRQEQSDLWYNEAKRIKYQMLHDPKYRLLDERGFIKRKRMDGSVQETMTAQAAAMLPKGVPLSSNCQHFLNPDTSAALPIAFGFIEPKSAVAFATMNSLEQLWNQTWDSGGYGRYHVTSEPDSPGPWPFASLFLARAYLEMGEYDKVWRILNWLQAIPGGQSGAWFEFYGERLAPPFPQVGIPPWTWAELLLLLLHHCAGFQPELDHLFLRPKLLPGIDHIDMELPLREHRLQVTIQRVDEKTAAGFRSSSGILESSDSSAKISYPRSDGWVEARIYE
ncbi:MAG: hypothetical protein ONB16_13520 [candidate division KSB1 bacterium]|nr:hypothetical protein [candidate division KSB1 bacterium]